MTTMVFVLTKNRPTDLARCLKSISKQTMVPDGILLINNGENIPGRVLLSLGKLLPKLQIVLDRADRLSHLFNRGWQESCGEVIAYIADDAEADPRWLENILETLRRYPNAGAVSGPVLSTCWPTGEMHRLYLASQRAILSWILRPYFWFVFDNRLFEPGILLETGAYTFGAALPQSTKLPGPREIDLLTTTSMGIRRRALEKIGGFDERFHFNHADGDLFVRLKKSSYKIIFDPNIIVRHHVRLGPSRSPYFIGRDTARFLLKDIRPKTIKGRVGFLVNILTLLGYFFIASFAYGAPRYILGIVGFFQGIFIYPFESERLAPRVYLGKPQLSSQKGTRVIYTRQKSRAL